LIKRRVDFSRFLFAVAFIIGDIRSQSAGFDELAFCKFFGDISCLSRFRNFLAVGHVLLKRHRALREKKIKKYATRRKNRNGPIFIVNIKIEQ
jgi:hypothetical protein